VHLSCALLRGPSKGHLLSHFDKGGVSMLPRWLRKFAKSCAPRPSRCREKRRVSRLSVEVLEDRITPSLVAAYGLNEGTGTTVTDLSGNGNNGTISNATWTTAGKYGGALSFNGTSSVVNIPDSPSLHLTTAMTLEAWVDPTKVTS